MKHLTAEFPRSRLRRIRQEAWCRDLVAEHALTVKDLILPLFIREDTFQREIPEMPGIYRHSLDELEEICQKAMSLGIGAVALFPFNDPQLKCEEGREALNPDNIIGRAVRRLKQKLPDLGVIVDVALDTYTTHGHDGVIRGGKVHNDDSVHILVEMSLILARSGVDVVAPSDMMDGRIGAIRSALDREGFQHVKILAYSAKYMSAFYFPYRNAVGSINCLGKAEKETYQLSPQNAQEAMREATQDIMEGADMIMVKPALPYLDIIYRYKESFSIPVIAFQVTGEYSALKASAERGWIDFNKGMYETLLGMKRAGASAILCYAGIEMAEYLKNSLK
jgi:porphobilinogen synthase